MSDWISVKKKLPPFKRIVLVRWPSGYDGSDVVSFGARVDGEDEDGRPAWIWAVGIGHGGVNLTHINDPDWNGIEADDDYAVTHWQFLTKPRRRAALKQEHRGNG